MLVGLCLGLAEGIGECSVPAVPRSRPFPDEGMRRSEETSSRIALTSVLSMASIWLLQGAFALSHVWPGWAKIAQIERLTALLAVLTLVPIFLAFRYGGRAFISCSLLRVMLFLRGSTPIDYVGFLNEACDRKFLKRIGGGYAFASEAMLDYFASLEQDEGWGEVRI